MASSQGSRVSGEPEPTNAQILATLVRLAEEQRAEREKRRAEKLAERAEEEARQAMKEVRRADEEAQRAHEEAERAAKRARQAREDAKKASEKARLARERANRESSWEYTPATPEDSDPEEAAPPQKIPVTGPPQRQTPGPDRCDYCWRKGHVEKDCWWKNKCCLLCGSAQHQMEVCLKRFPK